MREFLTKNKWRVIRILVLLLIFFVIVAYVNGRNIYNQKTKMLQERNANISLNITKGA
jgi:F0F1-type ATP synthase membrane subunit b/b'